MPLTVEETILYGMPICRGIAIGTPFFLNREEFKPQELNINPSDMKGELERYRNALSRSKQDIKRMQKQLESEASDVGIKILDGQLEMLQDPLITEEIESEICSTERNAEFVLQNALKRFQKQFEGLGDDYFKERFQDVKDVIRRVTTYLQEGRNVSLREVPPNSIVCAYDLSASDAAESTYGYVKAFITECGGAASHAGIVAKAKGIPFLTSVNLNLLKEAQGQVVIVDGRVGKVILNPSAETQALYESLLRDIGDQSRTLEERTRWPSETYDGQKITLSANIEMTTEVELIHQFNAAGIGLFRSEYIFLPRSEIPDEEEQYQIYSQLVEGMRGLPVAIRTFDLAGDKAPLLDSSAGKSNLFSGGRSTRFLLKEKDVFKEQVRAILRAAVKGNVRILFPMISTMEQLAEAKSILEESKKELGLTARIPVGCMIEVPSAAMIADYFARECDFLSIGTNDLVQYSLAVDRSDQTQNEFYEPTDPGVLRLIRWIITQADQEEIPVSVCGEMASDPRFVPLLLGLGVQELSVTPRAIPMIKNAIRNTSLVEAIQLAETALEMTTAKQVLELLTVEYQKMVPQDLFYNAS